MKKASLLLLLGTAALAPAQTPLAPVWSRPALVNPFVVRVRPGAQDQTLVGDSSQIVVVDRATGQMKWHRRAWVRQAVFTPDGASVVLAEGSSFETRRIVVLDANTGALQRTVLEGYMSGPFVLSPDGTTVAVTYYGTFRVADGARLTTSTPNFYDGVYSPNGQWVSLDGQVYRSTDFFQPAYIPQAISGTFTQDSTRLVYIRYAGTAAVYSMATNTIVQEIPLPASFRARTVVALGTTGRFVATGAQTVDGVDYAAWSIFDANGNVTETKRTNDRVQDSSGYYAASARGNAGIVFTNQAIYGQGGDRLVDLPINATGKAGTPGVRIDAVRASDYLAAGTGPQVATGANYYAQLDLLNAADGTLLRRLADPVAAPYLNFRISPSGRYLWYYLRGAGFPLRAVGVPGGGVANSAEVGGINPMIPLADDTFVMSYDYDVFRLSRSNGAYKVVRNYGVHEYPLAATADSRAWIGGDQEGFYLHDTSKATLLARSLWPWPQNSMPDQENIQVAAPTADEIVIARSGIQTEGTEFFVEMRRFARAGAALVARGPAVKRTYPRNVVINGYSTLMEVRHRLAPDGRTLWVNFQEDDGGSFLANVDWRGELIRTSDGAVLASYKDPTFDMGVISTDVSPANGLVFLGRLNGTIQAVPMPQGLAGAVVAPFELAGGEPRNLRLDLAAPALNARTITVEGDANAVPAQTNVVVPAGATTVNVPINTVPTATLKAATLRVTDAGKIAQVGLRIYAPRILTATFPAEVKSGTTAVLTIDLDGAAPPEGATITLTDNSTLATTPASVTVPAGARQIGVQIPIKKSNKALALRVTLKREGRTVIVPVTVAP